MRRKTAGRVAKPRICVYCQGLLVERKPVFLVATTAGQIVGPYHAGCAYRVASMAKGIAQEAKLAEGKLYGQLPLPREETLPW